MAYGNLNKKMTIIIEEIKKSERSENLVTKLLEIWEKICPGDARIFVGRRNPEN